MTGGRVRQAARVTTVVRLGQGVDETGRLHEDAAERTHACLKGYAADIDAYGPERRLLIATSVVRDARDGKQFLKAIWYEFALPWRILSGEEEGTLAFRGGTSWLDDRCARPAPARRHRRRQHRVRGRLRRPRRPRSCAASTSAWCGSRSAFSTPTRRRRRRPRPSRATSPPPSHAAVPADLRAAVRGAVGVAGTYTTLVANKLGMTEYDARRVQGHVLSLTDIDGAIARFSAMTSAERGRLPGIQPGREDVILAGALIAREACRAFGLDAVSVSEADLLEGAALALADGSLTPS